MVELRRIYWTRQIHRLAMLGSVIWLLTAAILALSPNRASLALGRRPTSGSDLLRQMFDGVLAAVILPGMFVLALSIIAAIMGARDVRRRDPIRRFNGQQRRQGMARAQGKCEMEEAFYRRCSRPAEHGDHFYPWSKGGATSVLNFVAACARCNRAKAARVPSPGQQKRMEGRRRGYFGADELVRAGERRNLA